MGLLLLQTGNAMSSEVEPAPVQPRLLTKVHALVPLSLQNVPMEEPEVRLKVQVDAKGVLQDMVVLSATHPDLAPRAESLLVDARFDLRAEVDHPVRFDIVIPFAYPSELGAASKSTMDDIQILVHGFTRERAGISFVEPEDLDASLEVKDYGKRYRPENEAGEVVEGNARIEFFIDYRGRVRLPRVISYSHEKVAEAALLTFRDMHFIPPRSSRRPATTKVVMPYNVRR